MPKYTNTMTIDSSFATTTTTPITASDGLTVALGKAQGQITNNSKFTQQGDGAITYPLQSKVQQTVSILDFGAVGDGTTDCYQAFIDAIAANTYGTSWYVSAGTILIPPGTYYISQTINLKKQVKFVGGGGAKGYSYAPTIKFAAGQHGFIVHRYNTNQSGTETTPTTAADGSVFEGLTITAVNATVGYFHGIWMRAATVIRDTQVAGFSGHGIYCNAAAGAGGILEGNANNWYLENVRSSSNGGCGIYIRGADANAGNGIALDVANNTEYGIADYSFLGNSYSGCHSAVNGTSTVKRAWVNYGGRIYVCIDAALGSTTTPGTNAAVWYDYAATAGADNWVYGNTYVQGGAYAGIGASARNMFTNCYSESGQPPSYFSGASQMVFGGLHAAGFIGGVFITNNGVVSGLGTLPNSAGGSITFGLGSANELLKLDTSSYPWYLKNQIGAWLLNWANLTAGTHLVLYGRDATIANGYNRDFSTSNGALGLPQGYYWGAQTNYVSPPISSPPISNTYEVGDICYNSVPTIGGFIGWVCITAGTPGTWVKFGAVTDQITTKTKIASGTYETSNATVGVCQVSGSTDYNGRTTTLTITTPVLNSSFSTTLTLNPLLIATSLGLTPATTAIILVNPGAITQRISSGTDATGDYVFTTTSLSPTVWDITLSGAQTDTSKNIAFTFTIMGTF